MTTDEIAEINTNIGTTGNRLANFLKSMAYKLGLIADYIVEQGTSGIWTYEKWNSGKAVCWGVETSSSTASTEGGLFFRVVYSTFPTSLFIDVPVVEVTAKGNWIGGAMTGNSITKDSWQGYVWCATDHTANLLPHIYAIGRWK